MNDKPHVPNVRNNIPVVEDLPLPSHRKSLPNTHVIGMSHTDLLAEQARILNGKKPHGAWVRDVFQELIYRGIISVRNLSSSWTYEGLEKVYGIPLTKERWNEIVVLKDGYQLPEV